MECSLRLSYCVKFVISLHLLIFPAVQADNVLKSVLDKMFQNYDQRVRPNYAIKKVEVTVTAFILPWFEIDERNMEFSTTLILIQNWTDRRLAYESKSANAPFIMLNSELVEKIWVPDTFIVNERTSYKHELTVPNDFVKIMPNGQVSREIRTSVVVGCSMYLNKNFPFDSHHCSLNIESYGYTDDDIVYRWQNDSAVILVNGATSIGFYIERVKEKHYDAEETSKLPYRFSRIYIEFFFKRALSPYISRYYIPLGIFALVSVASLGMLSPKISLFVSFFCIGFLNVFMAIGYNSSDFNWGLYRTALDNYFSICIGFIIASALVDVTVLYLDRSKEQQFENIEMRGMTAAADVRNAPERETDTPNLYSRSGLCGNNFVIRRRFQLIRARFIETISLLCQKASWILLAAFAIINANYWARKLSLDENENPETSLGSDRDLYQE